ncbi:hypothetical protein HG536_0A09200 [Torulaspora globosa]|uniref:Uncharacterized protein n=1 Tax=Torulaspora globosa TaxID=48254 RepID=A0A7G3ZC67_9SACH|nr:uncharacterized protein HG536_0A09200 [Torulaspora globosa]QLL31103.1 hypothetical protein HG536_0A09200 [Torulaspora globosa]
MVKKWKAEDALGFIYVWAWSVSMYPPIITNWKQKSSTAVSKDFAVLNTTGYFYLLISLTLQLYLWLPAPLSVKDGRKPVDTRPKVTQFDFWYCLHGCVMNLVLVSQVIYGKKLWKFKADNHQIRMRPYYHKFWIISLVVFAMLTVRFGFQIFFQGWDNQRTLSYCNSLFVLKISMSLIKNMPQAFHNYERKSLKGFAIQSVMLDITGGVTSLLQLVSQISNDQGFSATTLAANFGKIGLALVTLVFDFIYVSQWLIYRDAELGAASSNIIKLS